MPYTPPAGNAVNFNFTGAYTPPAGNAVNFQFGSGTPLTISWATAPSTPILRAAAISTWQASAAGGNLPYTYSIASGALPTGLSINAATGAITGTPTTNGSFTFVVRVTDATANTADLPSATVAVVDTALQLNPMKLKAQRNYRAEYSKWHKPWIVPGRSEKRWISVNYAPARVTWTGFEVATEGFGALGQITWFGLEVAYPVPPTIPFISHLNERIARLYRRRPKQYARSVKTRVAIGDSCPPPVISYLSMKILRAYRKRPVKYNRSVKTTTIVFPPAQITWTGLEVPYLNNGDGRVTWIGAEAAYAPNGDGKITWIGTEVGYMPNGTAQVTWIGAEVGYYPNGPARVTATELEVANSGNSSAKVSWIGIEVASPAVPFNRQPIIFVTA